MDFIIKLTIFAGRGWDDPNSYWVGRIYSLVVRNGSTITNKFIPARNSAGVVGMYDVVGNVFYSNSNTSGGAFVAGDPDLSANIYIPQNQ